MYGTYRAQVVCSNCGYTGSFELLRGRSIDETPCPVCVTTNLISVPEGSEVRVTSTRFGFTYEEDTAEEEISVKEDSELCP